MLPPNESYKSLVNLESLYGIWVDLPSTKADIQFPKEVKDWFIDMASLNLSPTAPVLLYRSEPAKSTKFNFPTVICWDPSSLKWDPSIITVKIEWDLEDSLFIFVSPIERDLAPSASFSLKLPES